MEDLPTDVERLADLPVGGYVDGLPYLEMRLRMALTGTAAMPTDDVWARALKRLLAHLAENPLPKSEDDADIASDAAGQTPVKAPTDEEIADGAVTPPTDEQITHALSDVETLDIGEWSQIVMASDHPIAALFSDQTIKDIGLGTNGLVKLSEAVEDEYHFAIDIDLGLTDRNVRLTLVGIRIGEQYDWLSAEPTLVDPGTCIAIHDMVRNQIPDLTGGDLWKIMDDGLMLQVERRADGALPDGSEHLHQVGLHHLSLRMDEGAIVITGTAHDAQCIVRSRIVLAGCGETPCLLRCRLSVGGSPYVTAVLLSEM